jgi:signal peptidase I
MNGEETHLVQSGEEPVEKKGKTIGREFWELLRVLLISLIIVIPIRFFVAQPFIVRGASMQPGFQDGEYLVVDELSYRFSDPSRGDVVILRYPLNPRKFFIKRIVGLPGETVIIEDGEVRIKTELGELFSIEEPYLGEGIRTYPDNIVDLGDVDYFVLGDNRVDSADSRVWGVLKGSNLVGRAFIRLWPISKISFL